MGIREKLNENPAITTGVTIGIIVIALFYIIDSQITNFIFGDNPNSGRITAMYYTTDDGATYFEDEAEKLPPFQKDGKDAVRCYVYSCDGKKTKFVAYLERLTPEVKKKIEDSRKAPHDPNGVPAADIDMLQNDGTEVKKPGTGKWVKRNTPEGEALASVNCPEGSKIEIVLPRN